MLLKLTEYIILIGRYTDNTYDIPNEVTDELVLNN